MAQKAAPCRGCRKLVRQSNINLATTDKGVEGQLFYLPKNKFFEAMEQTLLANNKLIGEIFQTAKLRVAWLDGCKCVQ
jgi:hypothetical protein